MESFAFNALNDHHHKREEIANCLVDLHGTCLIVPFQREGIPYLSLLVIAIIQIGIQCVRIAARELNSPNPPNDYSEWHLLLGRFGLLFVTLSTALDYLRLTLGSFSVSWPSYIILASNATVANDEWAQHGCRDAVVQSFLWWYCCFLQLVIFPFALLSITYIYVKARLRLRLRLHNLRMKHFFFISLTVSLLFFLLGLIAFFLGAVQMPLQIVRVSGLWSLTSPSKLMSNVVMINTLAWEGSLIILGLLLLYLEGQPKRLLNMLFLSVATMSFVVSSPLFATANDASSSWLDPLLVKLLVQLSIGSHMWVDITHNPDDYGRLNDSMYRMPTFSSPLRQPLLAPSNSHHDPRTLSQVEQTQENEDIEENDNEDGYDDESPDTDDSR